MTSMEESITRLLSDMSSDIERIKEFVLKSTRQTDYRRIKSLSLAQDVLNDIETSCDRAWDLLDQEISGDPEEDQIISVDRSLSD